MALPQNYRQNTMASPAPIPSTGSSHADQLSVSSAQGMPDDKAPQKPLMPHLRYYSKVKDEVIKANQKLKLGELREITDQMWRDLPEGNKQEFINEYETENVEYERTLKAYHNSPAYKSYITAKRKDHQEDDDKECASECVKKRKFVEPSSVFQEVPVRKPIDEDLTFQPTEEPNTEIINRERDGEREHQAELTRDLDLEAAAAPVKSMEMGDASSAVANKDLKKQVIAPSAKLLETKMEESTFTPAVNQETIQPSVTLVPMEIEETKPTITEPVIVDEPRREEPSAAVNVLPPALAIETPSVQTASVVEVSHANPVEATTVATSLINSAPVVEAPPIVQAAPIVETVSVIQTPVEAAPVVEDVPVVAAPLPVVPQAPVSESLPATPVVETSRQPTPPLPPAAQSSRTEPHPTSSHTTGEARTPSCAATPGRSSKGKKEKKKKVKETKEEKKWKRNLKKNKEKIGYQRRDTSYPKEDQESDSDDFEPNISHPKKHN